MPALIDLLRERLSRSGVKPATERLVLWWLSEMRGLVPSRLLLSHPAGAARAEIRPSRTGVEIVRIKSQAGERLVEQTPIGDFGRENWAETGALIQGYRTRIVLQPPLVHILTLRLPKAARRHLRTAIPLQLRDHAPLRPELLAWAIADTRLESDKLVVRVVITRLSTLDDIERGMADAGLYPVPMVAALDDDTIVPLRAGRNRFSLAVFPRPWLIAALILVATPLLLWAGLGLLLLRESDLVARAEVHAEPKMAIERRLRSKAQLATALSASLGRPAVTDVVETLAENIPATAHAVEIREREDGTIEFSIETADPDALRATMSAAGGLPGLRQLDQVSSPDGSIRVRYEMKP